jgi:hypothetical protein
MLHISMPEITISWKESHYLKDPGTNFSKRTEMFIKRKGIEFTLSADIFKKTDFRWSTQVNFSQYRRYLAEIYKEKDRTNEYVRGGERTDKLMN